MIDINFFFQARRIIQKHPNCIRGSVESTQTPCLIDQAAKGIFFAPTPQFCQVYAILGSNKTDYDIESFLKKEARGAEEFVSSEAVKAGNFMHAAAHKATTVIRTATNAVENAATSAANDASSAVSAVEADLNSGWHAVSGFF